jgi:hypothetical protein
MDLLNSCGFLRMMQNVSENMCDCVCGKTRDVLCGRRYMSTDVYGMNVFSSSFSVALTKSLTLLRSSLSIKF